MITRKTTPKLQNIILQLTGMSLIAFILLFFSPAPSWSALPNDGQREYYFSHFGNFEKLNYFYMLLADKRNKGPKNFDDLSPEEQEQIKKKYREWESLPSDEKKILRQRMNQLKKMQPQERQLFQHRFQQWQNLSPTERQKLQEHLDSWEDLSPTERDAIRRRFNN